MRCTPEPIHCAILMVVLITSIAVCGCTSPNPPASPGTTQTQVPGAPTVNIQNFAFIPASITVPVGTTVTWTNQDPTDHPIVNDAQGSVAQGAIFSSGSLPKGASYSFKFDNPGTYPYHCTAHPSMKGTVIVT